MEFSIRTIVILILCLIVALVIAMMIGGFGSQTNDLIGGMFDFFRNLLGMGKK
jgi:hypothetical protein